MTEDWLGKDGICHFTGEAAKKPAGIWIDGMSSPLELVTGIVWNKPGPGFAVFEWDGVGEIPKEVASRMMGVKLDTETIDFIQQENNGRGILLAEAGGDIHANGLTPTEWKKKWGTDGIATMIKMRLTRKITGGGIKF